MLNKLFILFGCIFFLVFTLLGQKNREDSLWNRITFLDDSLRNTQADELELLLKMRDEITLHPYRQDSAHAFLSMRIGRLYSNQGDFIKAVQNFRFSINMIVSNLDKPWINPNHLIRTYFFLNICYDSLNRIADEIKAIDSCITIARRRNVVDLFCLAAIYKKIEYLFNVGDYNNCIEYATLCEMLGHEYAKSGGKREHNNGMEYVSSSIIWKINAQLATKNYDASEDILKGKLNESRNNGLAYNLGAIYYQLAEVQKAKGKYGNALTYYNRAYNISRKEGQDINCKDILNQIGILYLKYLKNKDRALFYFKEALSLVNRNNAQIELNSIETLNVLANIGDVYVQRGLYDSAFYFFRRAFDQIKPGMSEIELLHSPYNEFASQKKIGYLTSLLLDKGEALQMQYNTTGTLNSLKEAIFIFKVTDQLLDRIKTEQSDIQSKLFWRSDSRRLYEHAIEACYSCNNLEEAFYFFEKSRAVLLSDQLNEQHWSGDEEILKQAQIKKRILQIKLATEGMDKGSDSYKRLQNELFTIRQELEGLVQTIKNRDPLYYQSFIDSSVITLQSVQRTLQSRGQGLVEIFSGDRAIYVLTMGDKHVDLAKLSKYEFDSLSHEYLSCISNLKVLNSRFNEFILLSNRLYQLIFNKATIPKGRIIISPDGQYFPFEALVTSHTLEPLRYFINDYAVSYTYSAKFLVSQFGSSTQANSKIFLGVAPVEYPAERELAALKGSDQSILRIQKYFNETSVMSFKNATKSAFMNQFSKYRIIQLYTHASDSGKNGEPVIYLSDSALYLSDLLVEDRPVTRLIVLSACETGKGKQYIGEGIFSFNRGFAALGIPSSITNLWSIDDISTYQLTDLFYKYLAEGLPMDIALQRSKIKFFQTASKLNQLPYFWAASILVGKSDELDLGNAVSLKMKVILGITFVVGVILTYFGFNTFKKRIFNKTWA